MTPEQIRALQPGPVLDELAGRAVGLKPVEHCSVVDPSLSGEPLHSGDRADCESWKRMMALGNHAYAACQVLVVSLDWLPVSTDPTASDELALAALEEGLGYPVVWHELGRNGETLFFSFLQNQSAEWEISGDGAYRLVDVRLAGPLRDEVFSPIACTIPTHARALAVALAGAKEK